MKILLLEKDAGSRSPLRMLLERDGHEVFVPSSRVLDPISSDVMDLLMLDLDSVLPDGRQSKEVLSDLRQIHPKAKVIAFTGSNSLALEREVRMHGVISYMTKPIDIRSIQAIIDHITSRADSPGEPE